MVSHLSPHGPLVAFQSQISQRDQRKEVMSPFTAFPSLLALVLVLASSVLSDPIEDLAFPRRTQFPAVLLLCADLVLDLFACLQGSGMRPRPTAAIGEAIVTMSDGVAKYFINALIFS